MSQHKRTLETLSKEKWASHERLHKIPFSWNVQKREIYKDRKEISGSLGLQGFGLISKWNKVSIWDDERFFYLFF